MTKLVLNQGRIDGVSVIYILNIISRIVIQQFVISAYVQVHAVQVEKNAQCK